MKTTKDFFRILGATVIGFSLAIVLDYLTIIFISKGLGVDLEKILSSTFSFFAITIPERLIEYGIVLYFYIKKNSVVQVNLIELIFKNKILKNTLLIFSAFDLILLFVTLNYIFCLRAFNSLSGGLQLSILVIVFSLTIINILGICITAIHLYPKQKYFENRFLK